MAQGSLRLGRFGDVSVTFLQLQANRGAGVDRLDLALELLPLDWNLLQDARLIMWADLEVAPESAGRLAVGNIGPGVAAFAGGGRTFPARMDLRAILGRQQVEAIETARDGGPISLCLRAHGMVSPGSPRGKHRTRRPSGTTSNFVSSQRSGSRSSKHGAMPTASSYRFRLSRIHHPSRPFRLRKISSVQFRK
jgi:hypothetical protein